MVGGEGFTVTQATASYNSKDVATATTVSTTLAAGDFTPTGGALAGNYSLPSNASGAGQITARPVTIKANDLTRVFGESTPAFSITLTSGTSLGTGDTLSTLGAPTYGFDTAGDGVFVGTYRINVSVVANTNYAISYTSGLNRGLLTIITACSVFNGFISPIGGSVENGNGGSFNDPVRSFKLNSTVPVKFTATCSGAPLLTGVHTLEAAKFSSSTTSDPAIDATPTDAATAGNQFRLTGSEWHFNMNTKALGGNAQGIWKLTATLYDGSTHTVWIEIKK